MQRICVTTAIIEKERQSWRPNVLTKINHTTQMVSVKIAIWHSTTSKERQIRKQGESGHISRLKKWKNN